MIGKNVWKFHAIYWPALLLSTGLPLPNEIVVHGFLTVNGRKISKSLGNIIDPFESVDNFGTEAVRYYLLRSISPFNDGDFSNDRLKQIYNIDLANGLGNLVSRITSLCERSTFGRYEERGVPEVPEGYHEALKNYEYDKALGILWQTITQLNQDIDRTKPWEALRTGESEVLRAQLSVWLKKIHQIVYWLKPFLPEASEKIITTITQDRIEACGSLFPRLE